MDIHSPGCMSFISSKAERQEGSAENNRAPMFPPSCHSLVEPVSCRNVTNCRMPIAVCESPCKSLHIWVNVPKMQTKHHDCAVKTQYISIVNSNNIANIIGMTWTLQCVVTPVSRFGMLKSHTMYDICILKLLQFVKGVE